MAFPRYRPGRPIGRAGRVAAPPTMARFGVKSRPAGLPQAAGLENYMYWRNFFVCFFRP